VVRIAGWDPRDTSSVLMALFILWPRDGGCNPLAQNDECW
jgi:hypothetical protein